jgi:tRNA/rRNA methyltransferase
MNMGLGGGIYAVRPQMPYREKMLKMATHEAASIIEEMRVFDNLKDALRQFGYVLGTSARTGKKRLPTHTPRQAAARICEAAAENRVALLFGSEKWGLQNSDLELCHGLVTIPTAGFSSINLAQSVMILAYEIHIAASAPPERFMPKLATTHELEGMYAHISELFDAAGFVKREDPGYWLSNVRRFLASYPLKARDARMIRGFCRQLLHVLNTQGREG